MDKRMAWLRNGLLILVTAVILCLGWLGERRTVQPVTLPVTVRQETDQTVLERFRTQRDELELRDLAALQLLAAQTDLDETIRRDAAVRLQALTDSRQAQLALEGALMGGGLSPCVAVVTGHSVTVVTACPQPTEQDEAMLLELAAVHAQACPQDVRLICAEQLEDQ